MSFSTDVKNELIQQMPNARHCRIAELAAIFMMAGEMKDGRMYLASENETVIQRGAALFKKLFGVEPVSGAENVRRNAKTVYRAAFTKEEAELAIETLKLDENLLVSSLVFRQDCCKRAFLRGMFIACGSISDPNKDYHLEIIADDDNRAAIAVNILASFDIDAKIVHRKKYSVVYLKDGECIVDVLNIIGAHVCLMELENVRILKEMRNSVNRRVNCEAANIDKTIKAATRQIDDINYLRETIGFEHLSDDLRMTAELRLAHPECSLAELGGLHDRPVGRSGVNHRLEKLSDMADRLRLGKPVYEKMED